MPTPEDIVAALRAPSLDELFDAVLAEFVGRRSLKDTLSRAREVMAREAANRCRGNHSAMGRLLEVDRNYARRLLEGSADPQRDPHSS